MTEFKPHITDVKTKEVEDLKKLFKEYPVVGVVNLENLPTLQFQRIKMKLKDQIHFKMAKKRLMKLAIESLSDMKNLDQIKSKLVGVPALIFTKEDPFMLAKLLNKNRSNAAAKPGQIAPEDLMVPAGPTSFPAGPMIGELGQLGIKSEVKEGKISVKEEKVIVKEGEEISPNVADLLSKLGVEPMKIGLNLSITYQAGEILTKDVLFIDEEAYMNNLRAAASQAFNVALKIGYVTSETIPHLVRKAAREATVLAEKANILTRENVKDKVKDAERVALALKEKVPAEALEKKEVPKEEPKEETKPEEKPAEKPEEPKEEPKEEVKEEVKEEPVPEPVKEEPEVPKEEKQVEAPEEVKEEPKQEEPEQQESQPEQPKEETKEAVTNEVPTPQPETVIEQKEEVKDSDVEQAQKVLKQLQEKAVKVEGSQKKEVKVDTEKDISKIINELKDKKSAGKI